MGSSRRSLAVLAIGAALACAASRHAGRPSAGVGPRVTNLSASVAARSPRLVIASAADGVPRLLTGRLDDGAPPEPLAAFPGPLALDFGRRRVVTADGTHLVFQCEDHAFCRVPLGEPGPVERVASPPGALYSFGPFLSEVEATPDRFFFEVRRRGGGFHLYAGSFADAAAPRLVHEDPALSGWLQDVSADGSRALVLDLHAPDAWSLELVDLRARARRRLFPPAGQPGHVTVARFDRGGTRVLAGVRTAEDRAALLALDPSTGVERARFEEREHAGAVLEALAESPDGKSVAFSAAAGSASVVRMLDGATLRPLPPVALPAGVGVVQGFTPDGRRLVLSWSTVEAGRELLLVDVAGGAPAPLLPGRRSTPPAPPARGLEVTIPSLDGTPIPANLVLPAASGPHPVAVSVRSGPGELAQLERSALTDLLVAEGFAVVEPNVRGTNGFGRAFEALDDGPLRARSVEDVAAAGRWARAQPWADGRRPLVLGQSYGGWLALAALTRFPADWRAGVDLYGIADWPTFLATTNRDTAGHYAHEVGALGRDDALLRALSPDAAALRVPLLVWHGREDGQVPPAQSIAFAEAARAAGGRVTLLVEDGEGHGMARPESWARFREALRAVLAEARP